MNIVMNDDKHPAIAVQELRKSFGTQRVLNGISFQVEQGETVAVIGRSGGGKSVLLKLLIGLQVPDSGSIRIADEEIIKLDNKRLNDVRKKIGFLFQQAALYDSLSVAENVDFPLSRHVQMAAQEREQRVRSLLGEVGMDQELEKFPSQLSGGMQKRVGLARALALDPDVLLFDEPTAGLDPITAAEIGNLIVELKKKRQLSAIVVTHDVHGAKAYSDRMVLLHQGSIHAEGSFDELEGSKDELVSQFFGYGLR
jgi:phospholipid/cholesterol/gamma-HCH transport system ATP-binding protein